LAVPDLATFRERWTAFDEWRQRLESELRALPQTLADFREAVANFRVVANRLAESTEGIERMREFYAAGSLDATRRVEEAMSALQRRASAAKAAVPGVDIVQAAMDELGRAVSAMSDLNPFWRSPSRPYSSQPR
jgi:hypothetical protein